MKKRNNPKIDAMRERSLIIESDRQNLHTPDYYLSEQDYSWDTGEDEDEVTPMADASRLQVSQTDAGNTEFQKYFKEIADTLYKARDVSWNESVMKTLFNSYSDIILLTNSLITWVKKNEGYDATFLKASISIIFRESKGSLVQLKRPKEFVGTMANDNELMGYFLGSEHSQGYAQIQPSVAKEHGIDPDSLFTIYGSLDGAYKMLQNNYQKAKKYYNGSNVTIYKNGRIEQIPTINDDAALHMTIAAHNVSNIASKCKIESRQPWPKEKPDIVATTKKDKKIPNYFPNRGGVHKYTPQFKQSFDSMVTLPNSLDKIKNVGSKSTV